MKFLADESVERRVVWALRHLGFDVLSVAEDCPSITDIQEATEQKVERLLDFLKYHKAKAEKHFVVLTEHNARIRKI